MHTMHPNEVLLGAPSGAVFLPVCDHYCGVEPRISKALALQREFIETHGVCGFDVTLDCEDGAPVGAEIEHAKSLLPSINRGSLAIKNIVPRIAVRVHAVDHPAFESDVQIILGEVADQLCHVMIPKVEHVHCVQRAVAAIDAVGANDLPLHVLIESPLAVHNAFDIAAHPRVHSLSFGLMDFVSAHAGAIDEVGMTMAGQFMHPLVVRAKTEIASAAHAHGKVPSHCVVTEFKDAQAIAQAATQARTLGYTRMWSIHPSQIAPIIEALSPKASQVAKSAALLLQAAAQQWAPISFEGHLHDRASYRFHWQVLQKAKASGIALPAVTLQWFN
jgi:citrate lyase subunit beta/citryl-CoA lyase